MARETKYNNICSEELLQQINNKNKKLMYSFEEYLISVDKSPTTIAQYRNDLNIFFCWNVVENNNKFFIEITKREFMKFQLRAISFWEWSPNRLRRVKSTISSLSNFIENILDEEEEYSGYHSIIRKIESPIVTPVREKTILKDDELEWLLNTLVEHKAYKQACALSLAMNSGRRKAEIPRFKSWYFNDDFVLYGSIYKTPEKVKTKGRTSKGKMLYCYTLKHSFDPYLQLWLKEREEKGIVSEWLFPKQSNPNEPISIDTMDWWKEVFSKLLKKNFYWHAVRHYVDTKLVKLNLPYHVIREFFGWSSVAMVDVYNDLSSDEIFEKYFDENGIREDIQPEMRIVL